MLKAALYPWHEATYHLSMARYQKKQLPHALLFYGDQGSGCDDILMPLAAGILCKQPEESTMMPCGDCASCLLFEAKNHPDFYWVNASDTGPIGIDEIRPLMTHCTQTASMAGSRVIMIQQLHRLNMAASNALLKCLEEPNQGVIFLLASTHPQRLLPTILSRLQQCYVSVPSSQVLTEYFPDIAGKVDNDIDLECLKKTRINPDYPEKIKQFKSIFFEVMQGRRVATELTENTDPSLISDGFRGILQWMSEITKQSLAKDLPDNSSAHDPFLPLASLGEWCDYYRSGLQLWQLFQYNNSVNKALLLDGFIIRLRKFYKEAVS